MKASGQFELLTPTPIVVVGPNEEVIVSQTSAQTPTMPYAVVAQQQPLTKLVKTGEEPATRKSTRRVKQTTSGPRKRWKKLLILS